YLCPIETPHAYLVIDGRGRQVASHLFLPHQSPESVESEGELLSATNSDATNAATGVDGVHGLDELAAYLQRVRQVHVPFRPGERWLESWDTLQRSRGALASDPWDGRLDRAGQFVRLLR